MHKNYFIAIIVLLFLSWAIELPSVMKTLNRYKMSSSLYSRLAYLQGIQIEPLDPLNFVDK